MDLDKLNIREMLDKFKQTKDGLDRTFRDIFSSDEPEEDDVQDTPDTASDTVSDFEDESGAASAAPEEEDQSDGHEPENTDDNTAIPRAEQPDLKAVEDKLNSLNEQLDKMDEAISMLKTDSANASNETARIIRIAENISGKVNRTADRLTELNNSLAGVSKLNDSIFDLKNSQMNTKNSLGELQSAFFKLKKKMTAGVTIITVLAAVIAVLEVINLLS
ncbi:MAG: hypothetical protein PUD92_01875 [Clostridiales bacterium]|nr:hypothetical protein [Clostridiales bacterium]